MGSRSGEQTAGGSCTNLKFTGQERDSESGNDNFIARYNSSSLGRFMSADPENAGAYNEDPQSWNAYAYVMNNPLNGVDPDGRADCVDQNPFTCTVIASTDSVLVTSFTWRLLWQNVGDFARKTNDYLQAAYKAVVNSRAACTAAYTAAGAVAGASVGAEAGATVGTGVGALGFVGGPTGLVTTPAGAGLGGLIGGAAGGIGGGALGYNTGLALCSSGTGNGGNGGSGDTGGSGSASGNLTKAEKSKLGGLAGRANEKVSDVIISRGGSAANVRAAGHWADKTLAEAAKAAVSDGDASAETAIKIAKQAGRLGQQY